MNITNKTKPNKMVEVSELFRFTTGAPQLGHIVSLSIKCFGQLPHFILQIKTAGFPSWLKKYASRNAS
jgi:hypothetical protein